MMRSLYSGVAGLKVHQTRMDVIGNNIANVNTTAYKSQSVSFSELMYQTTSNASGPNATTGTAGVNAKQIGLGVVTGAISTSITTSGSAQTTNNPFDIRISGENFFVVSDGSSTMFTRDGSFYVDAAGNLAMQSNGYNVMGWGVDEKTGKVKQDNVTALRIMSEENMTYDPEATSKAYITGIVDKNDSNINATAGKLINLSFYDNLGYNYTARLSMHSTTDDGVFYLQMDDLLNENGESITEYYNVPNLSDICSLGSANTVNVEDTYNPASYTVKYTKAGETSPSNYSVSTTYNGASYEISVKDKDMNPVQLSDIGLTSVGTYDAGTGKATINATDVQALVDAKDVDKLKIIFGDKIDSTINTGEIDTTSGVLTVTNKTVQGGVIKYNTDTGKFIDANGSTTGLKLDFKDNFTGTDPVSGATVTTSLGNFSDIDIDLTTTKSSNNGGSSVLTADTGGVGDDVGIGAGRKLGNMTGISVSENGEIYASYDNGMSRLLGQIASAEFTNASGLEKVGDNLYQETLNSGTFDGIGVDISVGGGAMKTGQLEMSNVDLAQQFTDMITTQRGFQANSRIITTSDSMLEELVNLKR